MKGRLLYLWLLGLGCLLPAPLYGAESPPSIAVLPFEGSNLDAQDQARALEAVLLDDLTLSGLLTIAAGAAPNRTHFFARPAFASWRAQKTDFLLKGFVESRPQTPQNLKVSVRLWDVAAERQTLGLSFSVAQNGRSRLAHLLAEYVLSQLRHEHAFFLSRFLFVDHETSFQDKKIRRLYSLKRVDWDGGHLQTLIAPQPTPLLAPRWIAAHKAVAYITASADEARVVLWDEAGGQKKYAPLEKTWQPLDIQVAPSGDTIVITAADAASQTDLFLWDWRKDTFSALTHEGTFNGFARFDPQNGRRLFFISNRKGGNGLWRMDLTAPLQLAELAETKGALENPLMDPVRKNLLFLERTEKGLKLRRLDGDGKIAPAFDDAAEGFTPAGLSQSQTWLVLCRRLSRRQSVLRLLYLKDPTLKRDLPLVVSSCQVDWGE